MTTAFQDTMQRALDATRRDALDESEALLQHAMALEPGNGMPHYLRATNFAHAGSYELAEASYVSCLSRAPDFAIARFQLGLLQLTSGRAALAHASWELLLLLPDEHPLKLFVQGFLAILGQQFVAARELIGRGIARNHDNAPLNDDMQGVIARIDAAAASTAESTSEVAFEGDATAHFLLGAYRLQ